MRKFNTSGPNIIEEHYTLPRLELIEKDIDFSEPRKEKLPPKQKGQPKQKKKP